RHMPKTRGAEEDGGGDRGRKREARRCERKEPDDAGRDVRDPEFAHERQRFVARHVEDFPRGERRLKELPDPGERQPDANQRPKSSSHGAAGSSACPATIETTGRTSIVRATVAMYMGPQQSGRPA